MKKTILLITFIALFVYHSSAQATWQWAQTSTSDYSDDVVTSVATDPSGNVYAVGYFFGTSVSFGAYTLTNVNSASLQQLFVVKYDANGNVQWANTAGGYDQNQANAVTVDANGNVYITGAFWGEYLSIGSIMLNTGVFAGANLSTMFIAKYDSNGILQWAKFNNPPSTGAGTVIGQSIALDINNNAYIIGSFTINDLSIVGATLYNTTSGGGMSDVFVAKYNSNGTAMWALKAGGSGNDYGNGITTDTNGKIYITGTFHGGGAFSGINLFTLGQQEMFVAKYDTLGTINWAKEAYGYGYDYGQQIAAATNNAIYVTGYYNSDSISFGTQTLHNASTTSTNDVFLVKYDSTGTANWAIGAGGSSNDIGYAVSTNVIGDVYITGTFGGASIFTGANSVANNDSSTADIFIAKYNELGNLLWTSGIGGNRNDNANSLAVFGIDDLYIGGYYNSDSIQFGTHTVVNNNVGINSSDAFVAKEGMLTSVGINDNRSKTKINIYPCPFSNTLNIQLNDAEPAEITVYDITSRKLLQQSVTGSTTLNTEQLANGIYIYELRNKNRMIKNGKLIKE
ncbi:MAG: T9SS type A sorting domain-containing protein [Bacteroidota bacterium]